MKTMATERRQGSALGAKTGHDQDSAGRWSRWKRPTAIIVALLIVAALLATGTGHSKATFRLTDGSAWLPYGKSITHADGRSAKALDRVEVGAGDLIGVAQGDGGIIALTADGRAVGIDPKLGVPSAALGLPEGKPVVGRTSAWTVEGDIIIRRDPVTLAQISVVRPDAGPLGDPIVTEQGDLWVPAPARSSVIRLKDSGETTFVKTPDHGGGPLSLTSTPGTIGVLTGRGTLVPVEGITAGQPIVVAGGGRTFRIATRSDDERVVTLSEPDLALAVTDLSTRSTKVVAHLAGRDLAKLTVAKLGESAYVADAATGEVVRVSLRDGATDTPTKVCSSACPQLQLIASDGFLFANDARSPTAFRWDSSGQKKEVGKAGDSNKSGNEKTVEPSPTPAPQTGFNPNPGAPPAPVQGPGRAAASPALAAPRSLSAGAGDKRVTLTWLPPASKSKPTMYAVTCTSAAAPCPQPRQDVTANTTTVDGLTNGTTYVLRVSAVNGTCSVDGTPPCPFAEAAATPSDAIPDQVASPTVQIAGSGELNVSWAPPPPKRALQGAPLDYIVSALVNGTPSKQDDVAQSSPFTVRGLTNGTAYTITVTARCASCGNPATGGTRSLPSQPSPPATPMGPPGMPTAKAATKGSVTTVTIDRLAPGDEGGHPAQYKVKVAGSLDASAVVFDAATRPDRQFRQDFPDQTAGSDPSFEVWAENPLATVRAGLHRSITSHVPTSPNLDSPTIRSANLNDSANAVIVEFSGSADPKATSTLTILDANGPTTPLFTQTNVQGSFRGDTSSKKVLLAWGKDRTAVVKLCTEGLADADCKTRATPKIDAGAAPTFSNFKLTNVSGKVHDPYRCDRDNNFYPIPPENKPPVADGTRCTDRSLEYLLNGKLVNISVTIDWKGAPEEQQKVDNTTLCSAFNSPPGQPSAVWWRPPKDKGWPEWHTDTGDCHSPSVDTASVDTEIPDSVINGRIWQPQGSTVRTAIRSDQKLAFPSGWVESPIYDIP